MPIQKTIQLPTHVEATYWRISKIVLAIEEKQLYVNIGGFLSKDAYLAGATPVLEHQATFHGDELADLLTNTTGLKAAIAALIDKLEGPSVAKVAALAGGTQAT